MGGRQKKNEKIYLGQVMKCEYGSNLKFIKGRKKKRIRYLNDLSHAGLIVKIPMLLDWDLGF